MLKKRWVSLVGCCLVIALVGAACDNAGSGSPAVQSSFDSLPQLDLADADRVAGEFLRAWAAADYAAMYNLISLNSRDAYSAADFAEEYDDVSRQLTLNGLGFEIISSLRQGTTAAVMYNVTFQTEIFGELVDAGRTMRLIETAEGWRIAWSRLDIFAELAEGARLERIQSLPNRGNIYDRNGQVLVNQSGSSIRLFITQQDISNINACKDYLSELLRQEYDDINTLFSQYLPVTRFPVGEIDPETYQREQANLRSLCDIGDDVNDTYTFPTRRYFGELAPHVVGYISQLQREQVPEYERKGYPPDAQVGQMGIERSYEQYLAGKPGAELLIYASTGEVLRSLAKSSPEPGQSVYLTIDRDLQEDVQNAFVEAYNIATPTWSTTSPGGAAIVMDVKTGQVLAMVSYPWFNPSIYNVNHPLSDRAEQIAALDNDWRAPLLNRATMGLYPAGSIFKIVSTAAGLDSGINPVDTGYQCTAVWSHPDDVKEQRTDWIYTIGGNHGWINFQQALTYSCDPYFWELSVKLYEADPNLLTSYAYLMGLGVDTGMNDLEEAIGYIPNPEDYFKRNAATWNVGESANLVIGQGQMQITPLQIVRMVAAVANGGTLWQPQLVDRVQLIGEPPVLQNEPVVMDTLDFAPETFATIKEAMCEVTLDPDGTAYFMFDEWYDFQQTDVVVCGKTGTAQTGGEFTKPLAWFSAFAPQDDPEIAVVVIVENSCEGSEVAAPITRRIIEDYFGMPHGSWPGRWQTGCFELGGTG